MNVMSIAQSDVTLLFQSSCWTELKTMLPPDISMNVGTSGVKYTAENSFVLFLENLDVESRAGVTSARQQ
jgi:hypothetical protein